MQILNFEQGTPEWHEARALRMTASRAQAIGANGAGLVTYIIEMCAEHFSTGEKEVYTNKHTERGNQYESQARTIYELEKGCEVEQVGFVVHDEHSGCSPDGLVGDDGLVEFKNPTDKEHFRFFVERKIDTAYMWQIQMQLLVTGRKWCDFVSYCPNYKDHYLVVERVLPDEKKQAKLKEGLEAGTQMLKEIMEKVNGEDTKADAVCA
jgi:putative phage-type endonuclease